MWYIVGDSFHVLFYRLKSLQAFMIRISYSSLKSVVHTFAVNHNYYAVVVVVVVVACSILGPEVLLHC